MQEKRCSSFGRREFLTKGGAFLGTAFVSASLPALASNGANIEIYPTEDLMREHGIARRIILIYESLINRLESRHDFSVTQLFKASGIVRNFIENYHENLEETYIFPRFEKAGRLLDLVTVLRQQHKAGRTLTDKIRCITNNTLTEENKNELTKTLHLFIRMYSPHTAREDTVLFPAFLKLASRQELENLGDIFEKRETQLFGKEGFEEIVNSVAIIEKTLGIYDLSQFTA